MNLVDHLSSAKAFTWSGRLINMVVLSIATVVFVLLFLKIVSEFSYYSLWTDEIHSVVNYSRPGAWTAWTTYHEPNNHILFNIIASLVPDNHALDPFWARLPSFVFVTLGLLVIMIFGIRENAIASGLLIIGLILLNDRSLDLLMEARGYGLVFLAALIQTFALRRFIESNSHSSLACFFCAGLIGGAAIPIYIIYTGLLSVFTLIFRPSLRMVFFGLATAILGAIFYAPTASHIIDAWATYGSEWGYNYTGFNHVSKTLNFLFPGGLLLFLVLLFIAANAVKLVAKRESDDVLFLTIVLASLIAFIGYCLIQKTPLVRTTQFVVAPMALAIIVATKPLYENKSINWLLAAATLGLVSLTTLQAWNKLHNWQYTPREAWRHTAHILNEIADQDEPIFVSFRPQHLQPHLADGLAIIDSIDQEQVRAGQTILVNSSFDSESDPIFSALGRDGVELILRMRRGTGEQKVIFVPQKDGSIVGLKLDGVDQSTGHLAMDDDISTRWAIKKHQRDFESPMTLSVQLSEHKTCDEFIWYDPNFDIPGNYEIRVFDQEGRRKNISRRSIEAGKNFLFVDLEELASASSIEITIDRSNIKRWVSISEMWCDSK